MGVPDLWSTWDRGLRNGSFEVTEEDRKARLRQAYASMRTQLMEVLYEEDPKGFGSSISAPRDEYSEEATLLIVALRGAESETDVADRLNAMFGLVSDRLSHRVHQTWVEGGGTQW